MKKKLTATVFALIAAAGVVHAYATGSLSGWYEDAFQKESEGITAAAEDKAAQMLADIGIFVMGTQKNLADGIVKLTETEEERAAREMQARRAELEAELETAAADIEEDLKDGITDRNHLEAEVESDVIRILEDVLSEH